MKLDKVKFSEAQKIFLWVFATALCFFALFTFDGLFSLETFFLVLLVFPALFLMFKILNARYKYYIDEPLPLNDKGKIIVKRIYDDEDEDEDEETGKRFIHLTIYASNGVFSGIYDFFCSADDLAHIGALLIQFPEKLSYFAYRHGFKHPTSDEYFEINAFTTGASKDCGLQFKINAAGGETKNHCIFSFTTSADAISRLGNLFFKFAELNHAEFHWDNNSDAMFQSWRTRQRTI